MRTSLNAILCCLRGLGRNTLTWCRRVLQQVSAGTLVSLPGVAWAMPHDLPYSEALGLIETLQISDGFEWQVESANQLHDLASCAGAAVSQIPAINLLDLSAQSWFDFPPQQASAVEIESLAKSNFLAKRITDEESSEVVPTEPSDHVNQTYRGLYQNEYFDLPPEQCLEWEQIAEAQPIEACNQTTVSQIAASDKDTALHADPLGTKVEPLGPEFYQPLFIICKFDGREFLVPSIQARHWNYIPATAKDTADTRHAKRVENATELGSQLQLALASGLENAARKLMELADQIRAQVESGDNVSQTAKFDAEDFLK